MTRVNEIRCDWCKKTTEDSTLPSTWTTLYVAETAALHFCDTDCLAAYTISSFCPPTRHGPPVYYANKGA